MHACATLILPTLCQTLSRIGNWVEMDDMERMRVLRVLGKRNQIRLEALRDAAVEQQAAEAGKALEP